MSKRRILITGGAGFIGSNAASYYLKRGDNVIIFDNFSRKGSRDNLTWLIKDSEKKPEVVEGDVSDSLEKLTDLVQNVELVLHLAGQVAVTTSVVDPLGDFYSNALGTLHVLEAVRRSESNPILIYSSTNKVYGELEHLKVKEGETRYEFVDLPYGVSEDFPIDLHSPYGCSKGAGDQYVRDYARIYGLRTVVFRQSCIYGPRQFGIEDQGWLAWFIIALMKKKKISIYGNGKQVRDALYIDDLISAYDSAANNIEKTKGQIYNIGGGASNTISIWYEFKPILEELFGRKLEPTFADWRPGDQPIFVSDIRKAEKDFDWQPKVGVKEGIKTLYDWIHNNASLFSHL